MGLQDRTKTRGVPSNRGVPFLLSRRGALTHHPEGAVVLPSATVRSARQMQLLRGPFDKLSCFHYGNNSPPAKTCHRQLCRREGVAVHDTLFFFAKRNKNKDTLFQRIPQSEKGPRCRASLERTVKTNGNLSSGSKSSQPWHRKKRCCSFRLSELF